MKKILTIVGARPQFVKAAVVSKALNEKEIQETIIHTGQHYDHEMSTVFWEELNIPAPAINLGVGSMPHGAQTGIMMQKVEDYILEKETKPDGLMVYGDTNSTLAGAIVASKLHIPVIHVEAGLRSFNREMPEEINRILTDHASSILFCSSEKGVDQLAKEGITDHVYNTGDVMYDAILRFSKIAEEKYQLSDLTNISANNYILATIHRPANTDNEDNLKSLLSAFGRVDKQVIWPVHPRNKHRLKEMDIPENLQLIDPVSYFRMMVLLKNCAMVITDSGGLQKEAYWMKKKCITARDETEWVETLEGGWNTLTGADEEKIISAVNSEPSIPWKPLYGSGKASDMIAEAILNYH
ncbi:non-hydrolyzing UDP-N-acetylglucosamine 2-epimerase [Balneola sp. MJW-20]|uniref:non-hydrolyzing UDP-N-acetylglucosamine 2-epimerase n=1 Tax=Gracilimonas aurantiaca TaxID=3234185 RepID=UPI0034672E66